MARFGPRTRTGMTPCLLAAEIMARTGRDPGEIYGELARELGKPVMTASKRRPLRGKRNCWPRLSPAASENYRTGGRKNSRHPHHRAGQRRSHRRIEGRATKRWFAARPSGTQNIYKIYAESFRGAGSSAPLRRKPRRLSVTPWRRRRAKVGREIMSKEKRRPTRSTAFSPRKSRASIPWPGWPWTCAGRGIIAPAKSHPASW